jgi:hypothetical protein
VKRKISFNTDGSFTEIEIKEKSKRIIEKILYGIFIFFIDKGIINNKNTPTYKK